jgi:DNA mismatch repair protein MutS2
MDLHARTLDALDWPVVLAALSRHARTVLGRDAALDLPLVDDLAGVRRCYGIVAEVTVLEEDGMRVPVGAVTDVREILRRATRGSVLEPDELRGAGQCLDALDRLKRFLEEHAERGPELDALGAPIRIDAGLLDDLLASFDATGQLSSARYPDLGDLRARITSLKARIQTVLDELIRAGGLGDALQDRYVTERAGRFVVPVKAGHNRRGLGIVHATSQSGETVFVEPAEVVERTNDLKQVEGALLRVERRILTQLSTRLATQAEPIRAALGAAIQIDLACARAGLGRELDGVVPDVRTGGCMALTDARHPVLALRGIDVVANDLALGSGTSCLVLTGPNTGGKTVALKTLGLAALMVRAGIPVPAGEGSRVDLFEPVLADVGDLQSVEGDLSTFSGHVAVLKRMLIEARPGALILLDEIGVGTDPAQGAALARAMLEALVDTGARVGVTTHYAELKGLAASDHRFSVAAVQYVDGHPTYRVEAGLAGESHGLEIARRLKLPDAVVRRAREVLDAGTRELGDLMSQLEDARGEADARAAELVALKASLLQKERALAHRLARLEERRKKLEDEVAAGFERRLRTQEDELKAIVTALQRNPDSRQAGEALQRLRGVRDQLRSDLAPAEAAPPPELGEVEVGDSVFVRSLQKEGVVVAVFGRGRLSVRVGGLTMKVKTGDLSPGHGRAQGGRPKARGNAAAPKVRVAPKPQRADTTDDMGGVRMDFNTLDLRGRRGEEVAALVEDHLDRMLLRDESVVYVLHGHGTGVVKRSVRTWLPSSPRVRRWRPANPDEGGDAFTVIELA